MTSWGKTAVGEFSGDGGLLLTSLKVDRVSMAREEGGRTASGLGWILDGLMTKCTSERTTPRRDVCFKWSNPLPEVWKETSCCIAAVSFEDGSRRSKVGRLLNTQQPADSTENLQTQNNILNPSDDHFISMF